MYIYVYIYIFIYVHIYICIQYVYIYIKSRCCSVLQCVAMCISIYVYNIYIYISSRGFGERCVVSQLKKLRGSWFSTPMPLFCVICTIDSEQKCILDLYQYEELAGLILKSVMSRDRHPLNSNGLVRDSLNCKCVAVCCSFCSGDVTPLASDTLRDAAQCAAVLRMTAKHCNTLQHTATHCNTLQHTATQCNTLQHTATHCNTLQHTATHCNTLSNAARVWASAKRQRLAYMQFSTQDQAS